MDVSLIIPLYNEEESLSELHDWIVKATSAAGLTSEIIFVDDGSSDDSWEEIKKLKQANESVHGIRFRRNYGKSAALNTGFKEASGDVVITMDADLQDSPDEIPELHRLVMEEGYDLVSGWKKKRYDPITKTIPTKLYNWTTRRMSGIKLHDFNCGLKAYRKEVVKNIQVHGEMHRYIPVIASREGFRNIGEKVLQHQKRKHGTSKFGFERFINGFLDLLTVTFISRFAKKPMHLFGSLGMIMFMVGLGVFAWIGGSKLYYLYNDISAKNIADLWSLYIAIAAMVIGTLKLNVAAIRSRNRNQIRISADLPR
jgi:glycosyltransferase involved in cell wall biosynthesis